MALSNEMLWKTLGTGRKLSAWEVGTEWLYGIEFQDIWTGDWWEAKKWAVESSMK